MKQKIIAISILCVLITLVVAGCEKQQKAVESKYGKTDTETGETELERRIRLALESETVFNQQRPDYLPETMFSKLPAFPNDFYSVRVLIRTGKITKICDLEPRYWMQPEFFPNFEERGIHTLKNPPKDRFGAFGFMSTPAESVMTIKPGDTLTACFFMKSSYLVETFQGVKLVPEFPKKATITRGFQLPDGSSQVNQDPGEVKNYFTVNIEPDMFLLHPNFPIFKPEGIRKVAVTITASPETPPGNYLVGVNVDNVPQEQEEKWIEEYLTMYARGAQTKLGRPYFTAFVHVPKK